MKRFNKWSIFLWLPIVFLLNGCGFVAEIFSPYPSDETLENIFRSNKDDFDKLLHMFQKDSNLYQVNITNGAWISWDERVNLPMTRIDEYNSLFTRLGVDQIERTNYDKSILIRAWRTSNWFIGSKSKYYIYSETSQLNLVSSLDRIYQGGQDANHMKQIELTGICIWMYGEIKIMLQQSNIFHQPNRELKSLPFSSLFL